MNNELYHYNHNHDKLGRFAPTPGGGSSIARRRDARRLKKELNNLDKEQAGYLDQHNVAQYKKDKITKRILKKTGGNPNVDYRGSKRDYEKWGKYNNAQRQSLANLKKSEQKTWKLISTGSLAGYDISSKKTARDARFGKRITAQFLGGVVGNLSYSAVSAARNGSSGWVEGNKYYVKARKDGNQGTVRMQQYKKSSN